MYQRQGNMRTSLSFITITLFTCPLTMLLCLWYKQLVHLSTYYVTLSLIQATCSLVYSFTCPLVYSFTCPLTMLLCLWFKQLVYLSTRSLVHLQQKTVQRSLWTLARYVTNAMELLLRRFSSLTPQPGRSSVGGYIQGKQLEPSCR